MVHSPGVCDGDEFGRVRGACPVGRGAFGGDDLQQLTSEEIHSAAVPETSPPSPEELPGTPRLANNEPQIRLGGQ